MPNWCENNFRVNGKTTDIKEWLKVVGYKKGSMQNFLDKHKITMRSWLPMPQTFLDWDTTNEKRGRNAVDYSKKPIEKKDENGKVIERIYPPCFNSDEEYEEYSKGYDEALKYQKETYKIIGWYDYNCATLGTKWDGKVNEYGASVRETDDETTIEFNFDTAWNAPLKWVEQMIEKYPKLSFELDGYECGMGFHEYIYGSNGEIEYSGSEDWEEEYDEEEEPEITDDEEEKIF